ncbi:zeta-sarcoglycan-like isoform X2 [Apostichopus japonicus]
MGTGETGGYSSVGGSAPQSPTHPQLPPIVYKVGIYGWRKRCLYLLILLLLCTVIINFFLTVWILRVMDFSVNGMGRLRIHSTGIVLEGKAEFLKTLYASEVSSRLGEALSLHSTSNVSVYARNEAGNVTGRLKIGSGDITSHSERFVIYDTKENELLYADEDEIRIGTKQFTFTGSEGVVMEGPLETPEVSASPSDSLTLQSLTASLSAQAAENLDLSGGSGDLTMSCLGNLKLSTTKGKLLLSSQDVRLPGLPQSDTGPLSQDNIYEVCVCQNGRLFLAAPYVGCQSTTLCDET